MLQIFENGKVVTVAVLLWLVGSALIFNLGPLPKLAACEGGIVFDMEVAYSTQEGIAAIDNFGEEGRALYRSHFWWDLAFCLLQLLGVTALFAYATSKFAWAKKWMSWMLVLIVAFSAIDLVENVLVRNAINSHPNVTESAMETIRRVASVKLGAIAILPLLVLPSLLLIIASALRARRSNQRLEPTVHHP